jgi:putative ABC transport system substrate-binding protein
MHRRDFITLLGGAAAWPLAVSAQQPAVPVVGWLSSGSQDETEATGRLAAFLQGLKGAGYVEGRNVSIEYRWAEGHYDRLQALATDLVRRRVSVIAAVGGPPQALAAKATNTTIPIVFQIGADPVELGLVTSLNRPGGTLTGVTSLNLEVGPKRLELMHELLPAATSIALLVNPSNSTNTESEAKAIEAAARALNLNLVVLHADSDRDLEGVFAALAKEQGIGLVIGPDTFLQSQTRQLAALAARYAVPTVTPYRAFADAGGLVSYGGDIAESWRQAGIYTGRVLKGEKPADLPVQQVTKVELIINLKAARALGLTVPITVVGRADEVIE